MELFGSDFGSDAMFMPHFTWAAARVQPADISDYVTR
jgi:hypothetical protein